ncbi:hypothetical protein B0H13DRAFT_2314819 [Mycena leptocephala]|nr:hypothetical protein B0H13DRAFT_2314819 [Mycena leptocephala]
MGSASPYLRSHTVQRRMDPVVDEVSALQDGTPLIFFLCAIPRSHRSKGSKLSGASYKVRVKLVSRREVQPAANQADAQIFSLITAVDGSPGAPYKICVKLLVVDFVINFRRFTTHPTAPRTQWRLHNRNRAPRAPPERQRPLELSSRWYQALGRITLTGDSTLTTALAAPSLSHQRPLEVSFVVTNLITAVDGSRAHRITSVSSFCSRHGGTGLSGALYSIPVELLRLGLMTILYVLTQSPRRHALSGDSTITTALTAPLLSLSATAGLSSRWYQALGRIALDADSTITTASPRPPETSATAGALVTAVASYRAPCITSVSTFLVFTSAFLPSRGHFRDADIFANPRNLRHGSGQLDPKNPSDSAALVALSRTCKAFSDPALDVLWETQDTILHLLRCFPRDIFPLATADTRYYNFARPIVDGDWVRPLVYARRVRFLAITIRTTSSPLLEALASFLPADSLIERIHFVGFEISEAEFAVLGHRCPALKDISCCHTVDPRISAAFICSLRDLERLAIGIPDLSTLNYLGRLSTLKSLCVSTFPSELASSGPFLPLITPQFIALRNLRLLCRTHVPGQIDSTVGFFRTFSNPDGTFFDQIHAELIVDLGIPSLEGPTPCIHVLRRLIDCFGNLHLLIIFPCYEIKDEDIAEIAQALPRIRQLTLYGFRPPSLTLQALCSLAALCSYLEDLDLEFDTSEIPSLSTNRVDIVVQRRLTSMTTRGVLSLSAGSLARPTPTPMRVGVEESAAAAALAIFFLPFCYAFLRATAGGVILSALAAAARSSLLGRLSSLFIVGLYILHQLPALSPPQSAVPYSLPTPWTLPPLLLCSTSALDDPNDAQRTMSQLSFHESKLAKFLAHRASHPYAKEGPGVCYNVACASNDDIAEYRAGALTGGQFLARLKWKVGHSSDWERRQREYEKCDVGQTHIWVCRWEVDRRYYCERLAQLLQFCEGGKRIVELCACGVHHREYFEFDSVGGFAEFITTPSSEAARGAAKEGGTWAPPKTKLRSRAREAHVWSDTKEARTQSELDEGDVRVGSGDDKGGMRVGSGDDKDDMRAGLYIDKGDPRVGFYIDNGDPRVGLYADKGDAWVGFHTDNNTGHQARQDPVRRMGAGRAAAYCPQCEPAKAGSTLSRHMAATLPQPHRAVVPQSPIASAAESRLAQTKPGYTV